MLLTLLSSGLLIAVSLFFPVSFIQSGPQQQNESERVEIKSLLKDIFANQQDPSVLIDARPLPKEVLQALIIEADRTYYFARKLMILGFVRGAARKLGDREIEGVSLRRTGKILLNSDKEDQARTAWREAIDLLDRGNDPKELILLLSEAAHLELYFSDYRAARRFASESLSLAGQIPDADRHVELKLAIARAKETLGVCDRWDGRYDSALTYLNQALNEYSALQGQLLIIPHCIVRTLIDIGRVYRTVGDHQKAIENLDRALALDAGKNSGLKGDILNSIGILYDEQRNYQKAQTYYRRSLAIFTAARARSKLSSVQLNIGNWHLNEGRPDEAIDWYRQALDNAEATEYKNDIVAAKKVIAGALLKKGDIPGALRGLEECEPLAAELDDKIQLAEIHWRRAEAYFGLREYRKAIDTGELALGFATQMSLPNLAWLTQTIIGKSYLIRGDLNESSRAFLKAIEGIEKMRADVAGTDIDHQFFFADKLEPYHGMIQILVAQGRGEEALIYAEKARARVLSEIRRQSRSNPAQILPSDERERERKLRAELAALSKQALDERANGTLNASIDEKVQGARMAWESFQAEMTVRHPELRFRRDDPGQFGIENFSSTIIDGRSAYLSYVVAKDQVFLFVLKRDGKAARGACLKIHKLPVSSESLNQAATLFSRQVAARSIEFKALAKRLYRDLIAPAEDDIKDVDRIYIIPDGQLWMIPFQTLISSKDEYLIERFTISYSPSLSHLAQTGTDQAHQRVAKFSGVLAVGNPSIPVTGLKPLPESEREAAEIFRQYGNDQSRVLVGEDAAVDQVKSLMPEYKVLHFATHGLLDDLEPMYSSLALAGKANGEGTLLEAWEVAQLELGAELAVLSACDTAGGKVRSGEGLIGMSWAFLAAGARTVVVSLWAIDSQASATMMTSFHRQLRSTGGGEKDDCATTLRRVALKAMRSPGTEHPFFWAGFSVFGRGN